MWWQYLDGRSSASGGPCLPSSLTGVEVDTPHRASAATEFQHLLLDAKSRAAPPLFPSVAVVVQLLSRV